MSGEPETGTGLRAESAEEVLDAAVSLNGGAARLDGQRFVDRHPRATRGLSVLLVVVVAAVVAGKWTHDADRHDAAAAARSKVMLRLLGGGGGVDLDPAGGPPGSGPTVRLTFAVRDDGPAAIDILDAAVHDSGVDILPSRGDGNVAPAGRPVLTEVQPAVGAPLVATPGKAVVVTLRAKVDCLDRGLPARPGALALTVRGADGRVGDVVLAGAQGAGTAADGDYYAVCGASQTSIMPLVAYDRLVSGADSSQRAFSYRMTVSVQGDSAQRLENAGQSMVPGVVTTTDLAEGVVLDPGEDRSVVVTVRAADCGAIGSALGIGVGDRSPGGGSAGSSSGATGGSSGGGSAGTGRRISGGAEGQPSLGVDALFLGTALAVTPGDGRFPQVPVAVDPPASSKFYADVLTQLRAACPALD